MEIKEAFTTMFGFNLIDFEDFDEVYENSRMGSMFDSLEEARKMKSAYECLKEKFGWEENFSIYKYPSGKYSVESEEYGSDYDETFKDVNIEKIE